jgi:fatty-acid desaturase
MEDKIREYEKYIEQKTSEKLGPIERVKVAEYHHEMVQNFQHERLIHLIIMLFFVTIALILLAAFGYEIAVFGFLFEMIPFYALTGIVVILSFFYVKHYYFLENHIQALYEYTRKLRK